MASAANTVSLSTDFNRSPYYDDFDESKNFHRLLFRPGLAVQARELTQIQTMLQNQIDRFAEHIFKEGARVRGVEISPLDIKYDYVKLRDSSSTGATVNVYAFTNKIIKGSTSGVIAKVVNVNDGSQANTPNFKTFFVDYIAANTSTGFKKFANNEILTEVAAGILKANTITALAGGATGYGTAISVGSGIIFAKDHFIRVSPQTLIISKYSDTPSAHIGFNVTETIISESGDTSLLDPASGAYNYSAPGATRLKLTPVLAKYALTGEIDANNFAIYATIKNGILMTQSDVPQYSLIRDELARRTREESGDYIVKGLTTRVREHLQTGNNQGVFTANNGGLSTKLSIDVEPGKAFVQGYEIDLTGTQHVAIDKGTDIVEVEQVSTYADYGNYIVVDNVVGSWDVEGQNLVSLRGRVVGSAQANSVSNRTYSATSAPGTQIGTARVRGIEIYSGFPGRENAQYKMYLTDIRISTAGKSFANVESITYTANSGFADGRADVLNSTGYNANTIDPFFDTAIFRLPASAIRRLRDSANTVDTDFGFYKTFHGAFSNAGVLTLTTTGDEQFVGGNPLSDDLARQNFYVIVRSATANGQVLTGTVNVTSGGNTVTGSGTSFLTRINPGDLIRVSNTGTTPHVVSAVNSDTSLNVIGTFSATRTGVKINKEFRRGQILDLGGVGSSGSNRAIGINSTTQATVDIKENMASGFNATVIGKINKTNVQEAGKTINRDCFVQIKMGASGTTGYTANTSGPWPLGLSDAFRLVSVRKKTGTFSSTTDGTDVTSHFYIDNGQRDSYYDHARLVKKPSSSLSIGGSDRLLVKLDYFTHTNRDRGYFSVDSYPINDTTAGSNSQVIFTYEIPVFTSPVSGVAYDLRSCADFRPRLTDSANSVTSLTNISTNPLAIDSPSYRLSAPDYVEPTNGLRFPYPAATFTCDLSYYLPRKDLIVMDKNGKAGSVRGVSSSKPTTPKPDDDKMILAIIDIAPYPSLPDELAKRAGRTDLANSLRAVKNERFTMRDIGVIRDRVERLEYYTTLSLLEKEAKDFTIRDAQGNDRFKNGFLVDGFTGHNAGNVYDPDYKIAIDPAKQEARPSAKIDNVALVFNGANSTNVVRTNVTAAGVSRDQTLTVANSQINYSNGSTVSVGGTTAQVVYKVDNKIYVQNASANFVVSGALSNGSTSSAIQSVSTVNPGKLITLKYDHERTITQPYASTTRNVTGLFYNWVGTITLEPNSDFWVDTVNLPDVQINIDNSADNWETGPNTFGTQWGSWETVATGIPVINNVQTGANGGRIFGIDPVDIWLTFTQSQTNNGFIPDPRFNVRTPVGTIDTGITNNQTFTSDITQQRVGVTTGVNLSQQTQTIGNVVRDVNIQPFMRSRLIQVTGRGFKPSSKLYAFFDGTDVRSYITPCNSSFANTANEGGTLTTDNNGNVYALFRIPNDPVMRFRTGEKFFRLSDSPTNSSVIGQVTTAGQSIYASQGLTASTSDVTVSTTVREIVTNTVIETRTIQQINTVDPNPTPMGWIDPIAQTFMIDTQSFGRVESSGAYLTKVDIYFATKDSIQPVIIEVREVDPLTGYPTPIVLPYSRKIVEPSEVNVSSDGSKPTPIIFNSPVYVENLKQYALVILPGGGNPNCTVWISRLGENDLLTGNRISSQPAAGILFASSNDRTYTALQEEDLKFNLYFANFTSASGTIVLKNEPRDYYTLANVSTTTGFVKTGEWVHGETYVKLASMAPGQNITGNVALGKSFVQGMVSGATGRVTYLSSANNDMRVANVSTTAQFKGGEALRFRIGSVGGTITGNTGVVRFAQYPRGRVTFFDNLTSSNTYLHVANVTYSNSGATGTQANNRFFLNNRWIKGQSTEIVAKINTFYNLAADLINVKGDYLTPSNTSITPTAKFATSTSTRDATFKPINLNSDTEFSSRRYILSKSQEANTSLTSAAMNEGSAEIKLTIATNNRYGSPAFDTGRISSTIVQTLLNNSTVGEANSASGGYADARYITRKVVLAEGQDAEDINIYLDAYKPPGTDVTIYYKILHREDSDTFNNSRWMQMEQATSTVIYSSSENKQDFRELQFVVPNYPTGAVNFASGLFANSGVRRPANVLCYRNSAGAFFEGFKYFAIKIVLTGTNTTNPPRIRKLRVIALQK